MILALFLWTKDLMNALYQSIQDAARFLRGAISAQPEAAIILGTGLGGITNHISVTDRIPYNQLPHFPESTVQGHKGDLVFGTMAGRSVVVMQGRFHYYEGYTLQEATLPVRIMRELGARFLFVNSAAGGLNPHFKPGDVMIVTDHINLLGDNPLRGVTDDRLGDRFPDMSRPYDEDLIQKAQQAAQELKEPVALGVYAAVAGPSLETRAETRMLRMLGADAVGMSTVPEVIVGCQVGFRTLALAAITNVNLPDAMEPVSIEKVIATAAAAQPRLAAILEGTLQRLGSG
jgi:purine-nucleoside phosphorylase